MSKIATILGVLVVGTLGLASCGGSGPEESRVLAPTTTEAVVEPEPKQPSTTQSLSKPEIPTTIPLPPTTIEVIPVELEPIEAVVISAGARHACALHQDRTISCWGWNKYGQLGNGKAVKDYGNDAASYEATPIKVLNIFDAIAISAGSSHTCALHQDQTISCWGWNEFGQLGNGEAGEGYGNDVDSYEATPIKVINTFDAIAISAGSLHTCILHQDQTISCWGTNSVGQLGNGNTESEATPIKVLNIFDAIAISAGSSQTCALHQDQTISCWGWNEYGQLGNGKAVKDYEARADPHESTPTRVLNISDTVAVSTGGAHACALHQDQTISCWGWNEYGQLGNGKAVKDYEARADPHESTPTKVLNISDTVAVSTGVGHTCALHQDQTISCWGWNKYGQLGNGGENDIGSSPISVKAMDTSLPTFISTGADYACALHQDGTISCWGDGGYGQLGNGTTENSPIPTKVLGEVS